MPLTDQDGNAIPADDPRLPSKRDTLALQGQADDLQARLESGGVGLGPLAEIEAKVTALEGLLVNPDPDSAPRRLFEFRLQRARLDILGRIAKEVHEAREEARKPKLEVVAAVPAEYRRT